MKYGPVLTYKDAEEAKKLIGKKVAFGDTLFYIEDFPQERTTARLDGINQYVGYPFITGNGEHQFIREIIKEEPKYRPYKSMDEMIQDFKERFREFPEAKFITPLIWLIRKTDPRPFLLNSYNFLDDLFFIKHFKNSVYAIDGSPFGKMED